MAKRVKKHGNGKPEAFRVVVEPGPSAPTYYVNHIEVGNTPHDFTLLCAQLPAKLSAEKLAQLKDTHEIRVEPEVQVVIPSTLVPGLIRALTIQKETYEKIVGQKIQEPGGPPNE